MKIDPNGKPLQIPNPSSVPPVKESDGSPNFSRVLGNTLHQQSSGAVQNAHMVSPITGPRPNVHHDIRTSARHTVDGLLDALDDYRIQLKNPDMSLRMIEPYVGRMGDLSDNARDVMDQLSGDHPVRSVLQEAIVQISKEIQKFKMGYYVDG